MPYKDPEKRRAHARASARAWREANPEKARASARAWKKANPEKHRASSRAWEKANPEKARASDRARSRARRKANPEKARANDRARRTGWTAEIFKWMWHEQGGVCGMPGCGKTLKQGKGGAAGDHCHKTGQKRGILCGICNPQLGVVEAFLKTLEPEILAVVMKSQSPCIVYLATDWAAIHANIDKLKDEPTLSK